MDITKNKIEPQKVKEEFMKEISKTKNVQTPIQKEVKKVSFLEEEVVESEEIDETKEGKTDDDVFIVPIEKKKKSNLERNLNLPLFAIHWILGFQWTPKNI